MPRLLQLLQILLQEYLTSGVGIPSLMLYKFIWIIIIHETFFVKSPDLYHETNNEAGSQKAWASFTNDTLKELPMPLTEIKIDPKNPSTFFPHMNQFSTLSTQIWQQPNQDVLGFHTRCKCGKWGSKSKPKKEKRPFRSGLKSQLAWLQRQGQGLIWICSLKGSATL